MINPFSGIITTQLKTLFNNAISSLLYNDALTLSCTLHYSATKYIDCTNCIADPMGQNNFTVYIDGGPIPFPFGGICPMCNGQHIKAVETSEPLSMMVIWDYKDFINVGTIDNPNGYIQTLTFDEHTPKLKQANEITVANSVRGYTEHRYQRASEPEPCGFGNTEFVACLWKRI